jgi:cytochrome P450
MTSCFYALGTNPEVQEKLRGEVQRVVGQETVVTPQHVQDMHYLRDTIKETMRQAAWESTCDPFI